MFVVTADQVDSAATPDRVPAALRALGAVTTVCPFERTVGDEFQGVLAAPHALVAALQVMVRLGGWHIGVGVGDVETPLPAHSREADGPAFRAARVAVERAKRERASAFEPGGTTEASVVGDAEAMWRLIEALLEARTQRQWEIAELAQDASGAQVAKVVGVSPQAISSVLRAGHHREVQQALPVLTAMLAPFAGTGS